MKILILFLAVSLLGADGIQLNSYAEFRMTTYPSGSEAAVSHFHGTLNETRTKTGAIWMKETRGILRKSAADGSLWGETRHFHSRRYLPCDEVKRLAPETEGNGEGVWVETACGIAHLEAVPMTLEQKAAQFEKRVRDRHDRHGMVADSRLRTPGDLTSNQTFSNDNDGLWTAMYAAAKLFEYRATKSKEALARAEKAVEAVLFLEKVTGTAGYPARSWRTTEEEKPKDGHWYWTQDKKIEWKSDTSSDESVGHFFLFDLAWDLLPKGRLRNEVRATCRRMIDYILENKYYLIDPMTGKPTRWGKWSPEYFAGEGRGDSPLNSLELLSFLKTARRLTGDSKYDREFEKAAQDLGYLKIMTEVKERREELNYSDEELALLSFYPWMRHEKDPALRKPLEAAFEGWWKNIARQRNPLWNTIREAGMKPDLALRRDSIATLERIPMDLISWRVENSWRKDLPLAPAKDRFNRAETTVLLPPDERAVMKWNGNPFVLDGGNGGRSEDDGAFFLLPYWMGRYYGFWRER